MPKKRHTTVISIIGLGVIGGSLGLAIRQNVKGAVVVGFDSPGVMRRARERSAIDTSALTLRDAVSDADIVFVCTPVSAILKLLPKIARSVKPGAIVTDVGSVKEVIRKKAGSLFSNRAVFIGGHPMSGSEGSGVEHADPLLFQNAAYVLCPAQRRTRSLSALVAILKRIGARIMIMDAAEHDRVAAAISHLPQLIAVSLMNLAAGKNNRNPAYLQLAAGGFRDMTRIASSPFPMWKDILINNKKEVNLALREFEVSLTQIRKEIAQTPPAKMKRSFERAKSFRDSIPKNSKGFLHPTHDVYVWIDDRPGSLARISTALFDKGINISDIELVKVREGQGGTFRLSFESHDAAQKAITVLRRKKIRVQ